MQKTKSRSGGAPKTDPKILEGLNSEQLEAATHGEGPLLIVAGAGTGKTTVITRRIARLIEQGVEPDEILALAFGDKAAAEIEERVDLLLPYGSYNLQISTFHAFGESVLREHGLEIGLPDFKVLDEVGQWLLVRNNLERFSLDYYRPLGNPTRFIRALVQHFGRAKDELVSPEDYLAYAEKVKLAEDAAEAGVETAEVETRRLQEVANAYHVYQKLLLENGSLDFGDLVKYALELFRKRPKVLELYRQRFRYILIDEFQDTNYAQYELLRLLAEPKNNLTVVGDDDQSIFKFRGASISNILHFQKDYPEAKFISLQENYRSGQKILDLAHKFIKLNDPDRLEVRLNLSKKLTNPRDSGGVIETFTAADYLAEAKLVAEKILELKAADSTVTWDDFAILGRSHDSLEPFIALLEEWEIPYLYFANRGLYRKNIILDVIAYFKLLDNYHETAAMYRVLNFPVFGVAGPAIIELSHFARKKSLSLYEAARQAEGALALDEHSGKGIKKLLQLLEKHQRTAKEKSTEQVFIETVNDLDFAAQAIGDFQNGRFLETFRRRIQDFQVKSPDRSLKTFMSELRFELEAGGLGHLDVDTEAGPEAVKLVTVHGAKGLEFGNVFVVGLVDKRFPSLERREPIELPAALIKDILPQGDIHLEEERRLFYVAMTRAKKGLYLTRAVDYGGKLAKKPSRFLFEVGLISKEESKPTGKVVLRDRELQSSAFPEVKVFSFSQISLFRKCPLEYKYRYILRLPAPGAASLSFGQTIHATLERFLRQAAQQQAQPDLFGVKTGAKPPDLGVLQRIYGELWIDDWYDSRAQMEEYRKKGERVLKVFFEEVTANPPRPLFLEQRFKLKLESFWVAGKIDRVDTGAEGALIVDYKTGPPRGIFKVDKEQLLLYQWAAREFLNLQVANLQYWFLWDRLQKESFLGTEKDIDALKEDFLQTILEITQTAGADSFTEKDSRLSHECKFRDLGL